MKQSNLQHIYILTNTLNQGGAEKQSILLAKLLKNVFPTTLVVYYGNLLDDRLLNIIKEHCINTIYLKGNHIKKLWQLYKLFRTNKNSVIFSYLATSNIINAIVGRLAGIKHRIGGIRNAQLDFWKMIVQRFLHNYLLTYSVYNNYEGFKLLVKKGFVVKKALVIHNCLDILENEKTFYKENEKIEILTVGRFVSQKDYYNALHSFFILKEKIKNNNIKIHYTIIGYGEQEQKIRDWITQFQLNNDVTIIINPFNIRDYYKLSDIYLSTSLFEGLSNSIMEAMEFSLPVVATNVGDNKYLIQEGKTGYLCPIKDSKYISEILEKLALNPDLRNEMGAFGYRHLKEIFTEKKFTEKYLQLIKILNSEN